MPDSPDPSSDRRADPSPDASTADRPGQPRWLWAAVALVVLAVAAVAVLVGTRGSTTGTALQPSADASSPSGSASPGSPSPTRGTDEPSTDPTAEPSAGNAAWERRDQLQTPRDDFGTVVVGDRLWVVGGMTGERGNKLSSTEVYDPVEDQWSMGPAMPTARSSLAAAELDGVVYAVGGSGVDPTLDVAEALDTATGEWRRIAPVPTARYEHGAVTLDGKIYVVGGSVDSGGPRAVPTPTVEIYDPATDTWSAGPPLAVARTSLRTVVVDGVVYAAGGIDADGQPSTVVEVFDPAVGSWQPGPAMPEPMFNFGYAAYQGEIHAIYHRQHLVLDPAAGAWRVEPPPTLSRHGQGMIEFDGVLFAIGGCTEEPLVDINTVQVWQG